MALAPGAPAPDATLFRKPREPVAIAALERPTVLLFFPFAFSSVCTEEMCAVAEDYAAYRELGAEVVGVSVDSPYVLERFAAATGAPFPMLSDFNKEAASAFGVLREELGGLRGVSERAVFVIDERDRVSWTWQGEHPGVMPPLDEIRAAVERARAA